MTKLNNTLLISLSVISIYLLSAIAVADELEPTLKKISELASQKNYGAALEELSWARKELEKLHSEQIASSFPEELAGFSAGKLESNSALGFTNLKRIYTKAASSVEVSLTSGSLGGAAEGLGGLAALGKMAAMFGGNSGGNESFRIQGRTAMLETATGTPQLSVFLDSGGLLKFEPSQGVEASILKEMAAGFKLDELEKVIKGSK